jgi:hypothetical protein
MNLNFTSLILNALANLYSMEVKIEKPCCILSNEPYEAFFVELQNRTSVRRTQNNFLC